MGYHSRSSEILGEAYGSSISTSLLVLATRDEQGIALAELFRDRPGHQFGGATVADDHYPPSHQM